VNTEYRNKADAKAAVACLAAEQGLVDLLRFRGGPLPSDYTPFWEAQTKGNGDYYVAKRKDRDRDFDDGQEYKRRKGNFRDRDGNFDVGGGASSNFRSKMKIEPPSDGTLMYRKHYLSQPPTGPSAKNGWRRSRLAGSGGPGSTNAYSSASQSVGQDQSGYKSTSMSNRPYSRDQTAHPPTAPRAFAKVNAHRNHGDQKVYAASTRSQTSHPYQPPPHSAPTSPLHSRPNHYSQFDPQNRPEPYVQSNSYYQPDNRIQQTTYSSPISYPPDCYAQPDPYGSSYSAYPPPVVGQYPSVAYINSPPLAPSSHSYTYYGPSAPPPLSISTPAPYGHYAHPHHYPPQYPNGHYVSYPPHTPTLPTHYSSHSPSDMTIPPIYPPPLSNPPTSSSQYPPIFRLPYSSPYSPHQDAFSQSPGSPSQSFSHGTHCSSCGFSHPANHQQHLDHAQGGSQHCRNNYQRGKSGEESKKDRSSVGTCLHLKYTNIP